MNTLKERLDKIEVVGMDKDIWFNDVDKALIGTSEAKGAAKAYMELANDAAKDLDAKDPELVDSISQMIRVYIYKAMAMLGMIPVI